MTRKKKQVWLRVIVVAQGILILVAIGLLLLDKNQTGRTGLKASRTAAPSNSLPHWLKALLIDVVAHLLVVYLLMSRGSPPGVA